ncbi:energy transducer TonB [Qipengyuania sp. 6D47A]|uniref:Energy transducer TonB n=2 Tax=Qipengyuania qiaonensis TaxID=2867240 RepID=A0ABS7J6D6_9SPHN|nr:TonB family protein [Qipengyuania qiaonensis]MBX7482890.1 energy transducer TonB [Qipengyuania qiaonensis]
MDEQVTRYAQTRRRPNPWVILLIVLIHVAIFYVLVRSLAPSAVARVEQTVVSAFTVTVIAPEPEPEPEEPDPAGAQGDPGREAVPKPVAAPEPQVRRPEASPVPRASSTGTANNSGAADDGDGAGRAGQGEGTGSGDGGSGQGGGAATKPVLVRAITDAGAFPIPPGGRQVRIGKSVIVRLIVSAQGRATQCSIYRPSPFPETDAAVCRLALDQLRFEPARDAEGNPVSATFFYQQRFFN